jgi:hypothetical protein
MAENNDNNNTNNNININIIDIINNSNLGNDINDNIYGPHNYINYIINFNSNSNSNLVNGDVSDGDVSDGDADTGIGAVVDADAGIGAVVDGDTGAGAGSVDSADASVGVVNDGGVDGVANGISGSGIVGNNVINEKLIEIMSNAIEIMFTGIPDEYTELLEKCLLENMRYDDDNLRTTITYTIVQFISRTIISYERIAAVILNYASRESEGIYSNNIIFTNNYDLVYEICKEEIQRHLYRSYRMIELVSLFFGNQGGEEMENVKLVMTKENIVNLFPTTKYTDIKPEIKTKNERCIVCQEHFNDTDECRQLNCEHVFHLACIDEWLENHSYKCPCCRTDAGPHQPKL